MILYIIIYVIHTIHRPYVHSTDKTTASSTESPHHRVATFFDAIPPLIRRATYAEDAGASPWMSGRCGPPRTHNVENNHGIFMEYCNMELHSNIGMFDIDLICSILTK